MNLIGKYSTATGRLRARLLALRYRGFHAAPTAQVGRGCHIGVAPGATVRLGDRVELARGVTVVAYGTGEIDLGDGVFVGHFGTLAAHRSVRIGAGTFLAEMVSIRDHDHDPSRPPSSGATIVGTVTVGRDVWLAAKVTVLRDSSIGDGAVVAANAVARGIVGAGTIVGGIPARPLRRGADATRAPEQPGDG